MYLNVSRSLNSVTDIKSDGLAKISCIKKNFGLKLLIPNNNS
jgi:hypothetical protein